MKRATLSDALDGALGGSTGVYVLFRPNSSRALYIGSTDKGITWRLHRHKGDGATQRRCSKLSEYMRAEWPCLGWTVEVHEPSEIGMRYTPNAKEPLTLRRAEAVLQRELKPILCKVDDEGGERPVVQRSLWQLSPGKAFASSAAAGSSWSVL